MAARIRAGQLDHCGHLCHFQVRKCLTKLVAKVEKECAPPSVPNATKRRRTVTLRRAVEFDVLQPGKAVLSLEYGFGLNPHSSFSN